MPCIMSVLNTSGQRGLKTKHAGNNHHIMICNNRHNDEAAC